METSLVIASISVMWWVCLQPGQILGWLGDRMRISKYELWLHPLGLCPWCASAVISIPHTVLTCEWQLVPLSFCFSLMISYFYGENR